MTLTGWAIRQRKEMDGCLYTLVLDTMENERPRIRRNHKTIEETWRNDGEASLSTVPHTYTLMSQS